jgi:phosphoglycolate phosphatase-like HAD superfamily hydrolase
MKPLIVFDIDGTLTTTIEADDFCFIQTFKDLYNIDLGQADWSRFKHVTDLGVSNQIFQNNFKRLPNIKEINSIKNHFLELLKQQFQKDPNKFSEVTGAIEFLNILKEKNYPLAIATGGWRETALFKLSKIGLKIKDIPFASSNHHYSRSKITQFAIEYAKKKYAADFERIIYFGDGKWDLLTCQEMGIEFIGVDFYRSRKLKNLGAEIVIEDFSNKENLFGLI